jgi:hypothetical protein
MLRNENGKTFSDVSNITGTGHLQKGHGIAFGDIDNDGDQDIYAVMGGGFSGDVYPNVLFENRREKSHSIRISLIGVRSNRKGIGARIRLVTGGDPHSQTFTFVNSGGSFGSSSLSKDIGTGNSRKIKRLEVFWPASGKTDVFQNISSDAHYEITEGGKIEMKGLKNGVSLSRRKFFGKDHPNHR